MYNTLVMTPTDYMQVIEDSRQELRQLIEQREVTDRRISQIVKALRALSPMLPPKEKVGLLKELKGTQRKGLGLTEMISDVLRESDHPLSSSEIRDRLEDSGFDMSEYSQPLSTIFNTIRRLTESGRVRPHFTKDAKTVLHQWVGGRK